MAFIASTVADGLAIKTENCGAERHDGCSRFLPCCPKKLFSVRAHIRYPGESQSSGGSSEINVDSCIGRVATRFAELPPSPWKDLCYANTPGKLWVLLLMTGGKENSGSIIDLPQRRRSLKHLVFQTARSIALPVAVFLLRARALRHAASGRLRAGPLSVEAAQ